MTTTLATETVVTMETGITEIGTMVAAMAMDTVTAMADADGVEGPAPTHNVSRIRHEEIAGRATQQPPATWHSKPRGRERTAIDADH
jgi:hypothetical protein